MSQKHHVDVGNESPVDANRRGVLIMACSRQLLPQRQPRVWIVVRDGGNSKVVSREISSSTDKLETECLGQRGTYLDPAVGNG